MAVNVLIEGKGCHFFLIKLTCKTPEFVLAVNSEKSVKK